MRLTLYPIQYRPEVEISGDDNERLLCVWGREPHFMELLTLEHFSGCVNEPFATRLDDVHLEFVLVEARPIGTGTPHPVRQPFSLLFRNTAAVVFPQKIYPMHHPRVGEVGIFLVPIAYEKAGFLYQAVFN